MVVLLHFGTVGYISTSPLVAGAYLFVDFFFVLSGFVIAASYGDKLRQGFPISKFMFLRLGRVYPLHFVVLVIFASSQLVMATVASGYANVTPFTGAYSPAALVASLLLVQPFFGADIAPWNAPSWSIAVEVWTYLLFAFAFRFSGRAATACAIVLALASFAILYAGSPGPYHYLDDVHDGAMLRSVLGFSLGVLAFRWRGALSPLARSAAICSALEVLALGATVAAIVEFSGSPAEFVMPFLFGAAVPLFSLQSGIVSKLLCTRAFALLGTLSYSIYMVHVFGSYKFAAVLKLLTHHSLAGPFSVQAVGNTELIGSSRLAGDAITIVFLALVIGVSWLSYRFIEKPARDWSRRVVFDWGRPVPRAERIAGKDAAF